MSTLHIYIALFFFTLLHPVHVSVTSVEYVKEKNDFDVSFKLFWDDFEVIIAQKYGVLLNLGKEDERKEKEQYFTQYISDSFSLIVDGVELEPKYKKDTINEASIWLYYSYPGSLGKKKIEIENRLMLDMFDDQTNLLMVKFGDIEKGFTMKQRKEKIAFDLGND